MKLCCPHCGVKGSTDDAYEGRQISCPKCGQKFRAIPETDKNESEVVVSPEEAAIELGSEGTEQETATKEDLESGGSEYTIVRLQDYLDEELTDDDLRRASEVDTAQPEDTVIEDGEDQVVEEEKLDLEDLPGRQHEESIEENETDVVVDEDTYQQENGDSKPEEVRCRRCGKAAEKDEEFIDLQGVLYCPVCGPEVEDEISTSAQVAAAEAASLGAHGDDVATYAIFDEEPQETEFRIGEILKHAWWLTRGGKGSIWAGLLLTYGALTGLFIVLGIVIAFLGKEQAAIAGSILDIAGTLLSTILTAGLMYMGVKRAMGKKVIWKDALSGFPVAGKLVIAAVLQTLLIFIGFLLFILPGIYLMVGYMLAMPLIIDRNISPWQAMELSRKAIHKVWWKVFALYLIIMTLCSLSAIPLGIGLIWTVPLSVVTLGVVFRSLFGRRDFSI